MNGHLYVEYDRLRGMLGLLSCSEPTWAKIVEELEEHVTELAEWTCNEVGERIKSKDSHKNWLASFDGCYLT